MNQEHSTSRPALQVVEPDGWPPGRGYSNGMLAPAGSKLLFVAGQIGWDENQELVAGGFVAQFERALANVLTIVEAAGGRGRDLARLTIFVTNRAEYLTQSKHVGEVYRRLIGDHYPAMSLVEVQALLDAGALVEIEATAALP